MPLRQKNLIAAFFVHENLTALAIISCVEIAIEFWIIVFFLIFQLKKNPTKFCIFGHLQAIKVPQLKKDSKFDNHFNIRRHFQHLEYDMIRALV